MTRREPPKPAAAPPTPVRKFTHRMPEELAARLDAYRADTGAGQQACVNAAVDYWLTSVGYPPARK